MAKDKEKPGADGEPGRLQDPVFADPADNSRATGASDDELEDLEAFLDAFEQNPEATSASPRQEPPRNDPPPVVDFAAPEHVEALVHGLLKDDDFNLDVQNDKKAEPQPKASPTPTTGAGNTVSARARAKKESTRMTTSQRPAPATVTVLVMSTIALLVSIGAGWAVFGQRDDAASEPALSSAMTEIAGLKRQLSALARQPATDMDALAERMNELQQSVDALEAKLVTAPAPPAATEAVVAGDAPTSAAPAESAPVTPAAAAKPTAAPASAKPAAAAGPVKPAAGTPTGGKAVSKATRTQTWLVILVSFAERKGAEAAQKHAKAQGIDTRIVVVQHEGRTWYRLAVGGFDSAEAARVYVSGEAKKAGYAQAWIAGPQDF